MTDPEWSSSLEWRALYEPDPEDKGRPGPAAGRTALKRAPAKNADRAPAPDPEAKTAERPTEHTPEDAGAGAERFRELGDTVAQILGSAHQVAEDLRRESEAALEQHKAEVQADLRRREAALDQTEKELARRLEGVEEQGRAVLAQARQDAEKLADTIKADIESWLTAAQAMKDAVKAGADAKPNGATPAAKRD